MFGAGHYTRSRQSQLEHGGFAPYVLYRNKTAKSGLAHRDNTMKSVLITGANRGIGLGHARAFAARGVRVYATARTPAEAADIQALARDNPQVTLHAYDARDAGAAAKLKHELDGAPLDLLFANAGVIGNDASQSFGSVDADNVIETIRINALAPLKLAEIFADNVARSERKLMAFQSSLMGSVADNGSGGYYAYRLSKSALNMVARGVAKDLGSRGVISLALHPGWVQTRMGGGGAKVSVEDCVKGQQRIFDSATSKESGRFFNYDGKELPW